MDVGSYSYAVSGQGQSRVVTTAIVLNIAIQLLLEPSPRSSEEAPRRRGRSYVGVLLLRHEADCSAAPSAHASEIGGRFFERLPSRRAPRLPSGVQLMELEQSD